MKQARTVLFCAAALLLTVAVVWASDAEGGHEGLNWKNFIYRIINFAAVVGVLWYLLGKKVKNTFSSRKLTIENQLADLEERKLVSQKRLEDVERSIAALESEKAAILEDYRAQGEALKASIIAAAEEQAAKTLAQARVSAEQEAKMAVNALRAEMAEKIVAAAQSLLMEKLTAEAQNKLVDDALDKVVLN